MLVESPNQFMNNYLVNKYKIEETDIVKLLFDDTLNNTYEQIY